MRSHGFRRGLTLLLMLALLLCAAAPGLAAGEDAPALRQFAVAALADAAGLTAAEPACATLADFSDADALDGAYVPEWEAALSRGLLRGYGDGTLRPAEPIRRVEALLFLSRCLPELPAVREPARFADVPAWARADVERLSAAGLIEGVGGGKLGADDLLTEDQTLLLARRVRTLVASGAAMPTLSRAGYTLEQVVVFSRHNIRSPLSSNGSALGTITPHEWFRWSSGPSELSLRGGVLETEMGQYFRKWLEGEGLIPENWRPEDGAVRFYSNSKQRTIATARYFSAGFLPSAQPEIEYHVEFNKMDPVFTPQLTFFTPDYAADAEAQIRALFTERIRGLADNYALLADVIDMERSPGRADGTIPAFSTEDSAFILQLNAEPAVSGSLKTACSVSDALVLQLYEEADERAAAFGHALTGAQWEAISEVKDVYVDVLFTAPLIAANVAHPLLKELRGELTAEGRTFSFLCGHDSNVGSVLAALGAEPYAAPFAIEKAAPIGCKLVMGRWTAPDGERFISLDLVYQTVDELRGLTLLDGAAAAPAVLPIALSGLPAADAGLYAEADFLARLDDAVAEYDRIAETYADPAADAA